MKNAPGNIFIHAQAVLNDHAVVKMYKRVLGYGKIDGEMATNTLNARS